MTVVPIRMTMSCSVEPEDDIVRALQYRCPCRHHGRSHTTVHATQGIVVLIGPGGVARGGSSVGVWQPIVVVGVRVHSTSTARPGSSPRTHCRHMCGRWRVFYDGLLQGQCHAPLLDHTPSCTHHIDNMNSETDLEQLLLIFAPVNLSAV